MCTKEKVYKWVFSVGIYAWIIFKDNDGGKRTLYLSMHVSQIYSNHISPFLILVFVLLQQKTAENLEITQQILFSFKQLFI